MLGQTVPSTDSSNREGPITDGGQPCTTDIQRQFRDVFHGHYQQQTATFQCLDATYMTRLLVSVIRLTFQFTDVYTPPIRDKRHNAAIHGLLYNTEC